mgnify:FL=1
MADVMYDAIVVGSGITGGWAAKELTERGLKVLMIERGPEVRHGDYPTEHQPVYDFKYRLLGDKRRYAEDYPVQQRTFFFNEASERFFVNDRDNPYTTPDSRPFTWIRGHQLGGRSLTWGRQSYRMAPLNFEENALDGHGVDWPIRYADLAPWYDHVERFIGIAAAKLNNEMSPDGVHLPPFPMNAAERDLHTRFARLFPDRPLAMARTAMLTEPLGERQPCHFCGPCQRGCSTGSYFSTQISTLPAAQATGRLTVQADSIVSRILVDDGTRRATGVEIIDRNTQAKRSVSGRMVFLCASAFESVRLLLLSATPRWPGGLANSSGALGRYIMDHHSSDLVVTTVPAKPMAHYSGYRPVPLTMPRFRNVKEKRSDYVRGYQVNGGAALQDWERGLRMPGVGVAFKNALRKTGDWSLFLAAQGEMLPDAGNRITLDRSVRDKWGMPVLHIDVAWGENERAMQRDANETLVKMLNEAGYTNVMQIPLDSPPGSTIHEMGGATMGRDPKTSVLDAHNRTHDIPNLFVTDGAAMASSSSSNPSLTYMALTARAAAFAAAEFKARRL